MSESGRDFSYELGSADTSRQNIAKVRLRLGDKIERKAYLSDTEILVFLGDVNNHIIKASALGADAIAAFLAREIETSTGAIQKDAASAYKHYSDLAQRLRKQAINSTSFVQANKDKSDIDNLATSTTARQPLFRRGMHRNRQTGVDTGIAQYDELDN